MNETLFSKNLFLFSKFIKIDMILLKTKRLCFNLINTDLNFLSKNQFFYITKIDLIFFHKLKSIFFITKTYLNFLYIKKRIHS